MYREVDAVDVVDGLYDTTLGDNQSAGSASSLLGALNTLGTNAWMGIKFGTDPELTPRERLRSAPFAMKAAGVPDGAITADSIASGAVTADKIAAGAVSALYAPDGISTGIVVEPVHIEPRGTTGDGLGNPFAVAVQGSYAYVVDTDTDSLLIFDVSDPKNIVAKDSDSTGLSYPTSVAVTGNYAYVVDATAGVLAIFDVSDPDNIVPKDSDSTGLTFPTSVAVAGNYAYVADAIAGVLAIFDVSDPDNIVARDSDGTGLSFPTSVAVAGDYAYVVDQQSAILAIFDVSNPLIIRPMGTNGTGLSSPVDVAVQGNYAYVVDTDTDSLVIFDVSDPKRIVAKDSYSTGLLAPSSIAVQGNHAYVVDSGTAVLEIFDVSDPDNIVAKYTDSTGLLNPRSVAVEGSYAYVVDSGTDVLAIFELAPPAVTVTAEGGLTAESFAGDGSGLTGIHSLDASDGVPADAVFVDSDGNVGIGTDTPLEKLHIAGAAVLGNSTAATPVAGTIRWTGSDFEGYDGSQWVSLIFQPAPAGMMVRIPAGVNSGTDPDGGAYSLTNAADLYMDKYEVTKALWDEVKNWNGGNEYSYEHAGSAKTATHPVHTVSWYDCVKWCNARSQKEGREAVYYTDAGFTQIYKTGDVPEPYVKTSANGYRLPTGTEWEYAARGGVSSKRFPWGGDTIDHVYVNYRANGSAYAYDTSPYTNSTYHPDYNDGSTPYTSPVGVFESGRNAYGLYDMAGNVAEWCHDWYWPDERMTRGSSWYFNAYYCRVARRTSYYPNFAGYFVGFRSVLPPDQ